MRKALSAMRDNPDALIDIIERLQAIVDSLRDENKKLGLQNKLLREKLDDLQRESKRPAAPFRIGDEKRKTSPKKPGRPQGHKGAFRRRPDRIDETVEVPLELCPHCGGQVLDVEPVEQFIEDIPPVRPYVTRLVTHVGRCPRCGEVRSTHPLQVSTATGAAAAQLGPRALGTAMDLVHGHGLTRRKTCRILDDLFGLRLTPGGLTQAAGRMAGKLSGRYLSLVDQARCEPVIHADETSWWVGGPHWWLWVFTSPPV